METSYCSSLKDIDTKYIFAMILFISVGCAILLGLSFRSIDLSSLDEAPEETKQ